ncbi:hypothetical protein, partial [Abiotrophia sp. HMSC24B09]|uniref:hypothetical protein n=1 Tax=Abiotrophia sp. HMSC24B09 TaxID=1581061 RepID=UPI001C5864E6
FPAKTKEPVDHSRKWATGSRETGEFPWFPAKTKEPVVDSGKWTTANTPDFDCFLQVTSS